MKIVLVHGWGCHAGVWRKLVPLLDGHEIHLIDLGFVRNGPQCSSELPPDSLCIGHSFGVLWLLKHGPRPVKGLVSIGGFDCLYKHVPEEVLAGMRQDMLERPAESMSDFWDSLGLKGEDRPSPDDLDGGGLRAGLDWIATWDAGDELKALDAPVMALAAENDRVVRKDASIAMWGNGVSKLVWHETAGHMMQLTEPDWCAQHINRFIDAIDAE